MKPPLDGSQQESPSAETPIAPRPDAQGKHRRIYGFALARFEAWALPKLAAALPARVMPDHLTALGLLASTGIAVSYMLTNRDPAWLWVASGLLVVQWYGDSLDGTLARFRKIERPRYGFYLDHLTDAYSTLAIGLGLGFSPYMLLSVGLAITIAYLLLSVNVYLETHVFGEFKLGHGIVGPTEARVLLIALNTGAAILGPMRFYLGGVPFTPYDVLGLIGVAGMVALLLSRATRNLKALAVLEPPGRRRDVQEPPS